MSEENVEIVRNRYASRYNAGESSRPWLLARRTPNTTPDSRRPRLQQRIIVGSTRSGVSSRTLARGRTPISRWEPLEAKGKGDRVFPLGSASPVMERASGVPMEM